MIPTQAYAAHGPKRPLEYFEIERRDPGPKDILIEIHYCGICHSDIHQVRGEWGNSNYPMVPGHEIAGVVKAAGKKVKKFKIGDKAGIGCFVDSCRKCDPCRKGLEQYCDGHVSWTYNGTEKDQKTPTFGGYSTHIVVDENYAVKIRSKAPLSQIAPLLCAGITTYSPLKHFRVSRGQKIAIVGMGGLGHMAVKLAASMGAQVTVFSTSESKRNDARRFGAKEFVNTKEPGALEKNANRFDFILNTVSGIFDLDAYLRLLRRDGTMVIVGAPEHPEKFNAFSLIVKRRKLAGSVIGGIRETQEMLDYCAKHHITSDVEIIPASKINDAYERTVKSDVRYRFVIDVRSIK